MIDHLRDADQLRSMTHFVPPASFLDVLHEGVTSGRLTVEGVVPADACARVVSMERRPMSLLHPTVAWRVLRPAIGPWRPGSNDDARPTGPSPGVPEGEGSVEDAVGAETEGNSSP